MTIASTVMTKCATTPYTLQRYSLVLKPPQAFYRFVIAEFAAISHYVLEMAECSGKVTTV